MKNYILEYFNLKSGNQFMVLPCKNLCFTLRICQGEGFSFLFVVENGHDFVFVSVFVGQVEYDFVVIIGFICTLNFEIVVINSDIFA